MTQTPGSTTPTEVTTPGASDDASGTPPTPSGTKRGRRTTRRSVCSARRALTLRTIRVHIARTAGWLARRWAAVWAWLATRLDRLLGRRVLVEILLTDRRRRRHLLREVGTGLRQLRRVLGASFPAHLTVVVQQAVCPTAAGRQLAGCAHVGVLPDGTRFAHVRLALQVDGQSLTHDEVLAALAEQCLGLASQHGGAATVLVPLDLKPEARRPAPTDVSQQRPLGQAAPSRVDRLDPLLGHRTPPPNAGTPLTASPTAAPTATAANSAWTTTA